MTYPYSIADATRKLRHVFVHDLALQAAIGVWRHEQGRRQRIRINLDLAVHESDAGADVLEDVVCYQDLVDRVKGIVEGSRVKLVETLAERIAAICLKDSRVWSVRVRVEKLDAIPEAASVGVEIERLQRR